MKTVFFLQVIVLILFIPLIGNTQYLMLKCSISDVQTGLGIKDVNILESNTGIGTITNDNGFFSLMLRPGEINLLITHSNFKDFAKKMILKTDSTFTISLEPVLNIKSRQKPEADSPHAAKTDKKK